MCFAPQRRALFRHLNFQKWSEAGVLCTFWLENVLRTTAACNFSSLIWPHGSAPAALASPFFDPPEPQIIGKHRVSQLYLFALDLLSSDSFSFLIFFLLLFSSLTLPTCAFPSVHIVGSLTSKLPSINIMFIWWNKLRKIWMITGGTIILGHLHLPIITYLPMCLPRLRSHPWMIFLPKGKAHDLVVKGRESHPPKKMVATH